MDGNELSALLGSGVITAQARPELAAVDLLYPAEAQSIARAVVRRKAEFATARVLARRALAQLDIEPQPLPPNPDRSPFWPPGIVGSITHTTDYCAVAVGRTTDVGGLGIDAESADALSTKILPMICTVTEQRWLNTLATPEQGPMAKLIFSAKEAFYKCQYPLTGTFLDFLNVEVRIDVAASEFRVVVREGLDPVPEALQRAVGRFTRGPRRVITAFRL